MKLHIYVDLVFLIVFLNFTCTKNNSDSNVITPENSNTELNIGCDLITQEHIGSDPGCEIIIFGSGNRDCSTVERLCEIITDATQKTVLAWGGDDFWNKFPLKIELGFILSRGEKINAGIGKDAVIIYVPKDVSDCDIFGAVLHELGHYVFEYYNDTLFSDSWYYNSEIDGTRFLILAYNELFADAFAIFYLNELAIIASATDNPLRDFSKDFTVDSIKNIQYSHTYFIQAHSALLRFYEQQNRMDFLQDILIAIKNHFFIAITEHSKFTSKETAQTLNNSLIQAFNEIPLTRTSSE